MFGVRRGSVCGFCFDYTGFQRVAAGPQTQRHAVGFALAPPLFAQPGLRRREPTAAAAVNISFPKERETQRWREREEGMTERTTVLGTFTGGGETEIFAERAAVWTRCQQVWGVGGVWPG